MLANWLKLLPYFMVEWLARKYCAKLDEDESTVTVEAFRGRGIIFVKGQ